jgi:hypothetical protein
MYITADCEQGLEMSRGTCVMVGCSTCYGGINDQDIRLSAQELGRFLDDIQRMFLLYAPFAIKVILQECNVGFPLLRLGEELFVCRNGHCRCLHLCRKHVYRRVQGYK